MNEKEQLIQNLNSAMPIAQQMQKIEDEIGSIEVQIEKQKKFWGGMKVVAIIAAIILVFAIIAIITGEKFKAGDLLGLLITGFIIFIYAMHLKKLKGEKQRIDALNNQYKGLQQNPNLAWLHDKYRTSSCIHKIAEYVNSGRADSMKEALNLLEEDIHRQEMEDAAAFGAFYGAQSGR